MESSSVIVTGGGTGIGYAISKKLLKKDFEVIICSRKQKNLDKAKLDLYNELNISSKVYSYELDISNEDSVNKIFKEIFLVHKNILGLINNASILKPASFLDDRDFWVKTIETNLIGTYFTSYEFIKNSKNLKNKKIINIASTLGHVGRAHYSAYCSSKHGVLGFTKALALEYLDKGLIVNSISPGWVETNMAINDLKIQAKFKGLEFDDYKKEVANTIPIKRFVKPDEVSDLVFYLIQNESPAISGQDFSINGGEILT